MRPQLQRRIQRDGWNRASGHYEQFWQDQLRPAVNLVLENADLAAGEDVIDVACGTGLVTLPAAGIVAPSGRVLATDLSPRMLDHLAHRAAERGLTNIDIACRGAEDLGTCERFDVAVCSLGLMYVPDPLAALRELHRVLRPGGRAVVSVWGERRNCGWAAVFPIIASRVASEVCPMFFALGAPAVLTRTLEQAGFVDIRETRLAVGLRHGTEADALGAAFRGGPVALAYSRFDEAARRSAHEEYLTSITRFADERGFCVPGEFVIGSARRSRRDHDSQTKGSQS